MKCHSHPLRPASPCWLTFTMNSGSWGKILISGRCLFSLDCFLNSELTVCDTCHQLHLTQLPTPCGFPRVLGFSRLRKQTFQNIPEHSGSQMEASLSRLISQPETSTWAEDRCEDESDLGKLSARTPPWGICNIPVPQAWERSMALQECCAWKFPATGKITFLGSQSEPFHSKNFVVFPLCSSLP